MYARAFHVALYAPTRKRCVHVREVPVGLAMRDRAVTGALRSRTAQGIAARDVPVDYVAAPAHPGRVRTLAAKPRLGPDALPPPVYSRMYRARISRKRRRD
jgi:hypothetical protein